ncbi:Twin-arginine translocation pathway signal [Bilophila wadsworthia]
MPFPWHTSCLVSRSRAVRAIPADGGPQAVAAVLGNHIDIVLKDVYNPELLPMIITNEERFPTYPDTPTFKEIGHPAMSIGVRIGMYAPKGTPDEVLRTLEAAFLEACNDKKYQDLLASLSMENLPLDQAATLKSIKNATSVTQRLIDKGIMTVEE